MPALVWWIAALLTSCGAAAPEPETPLVPIGVATILVAYDRALASHPGALPYAIDVWAEGEKCRLAVWSLDGEVVHGVHVDVERDHVAYDETAPAADAEGARVLGAAIGSRVTPLRAGIAWMFESYGLGSVRAVELEMHGGSLVLEAVLGIGPDATIHVHDPDDGRYVMTEAGDPPAPEDGS